MRRLSCRAFSTIRMPILLDADRVAREPGVELEATGADLDEDEIRTVVEGAVWRIDLSRRAVVIHRAQRAAAVNRLRGRQDSFHDLAGVALNEPAVEPGEESHVGQPLVGSRQEGAARGPRAAGMASRTSARWGEPTGRVRRRTSRAAAYSGDDAPGDQLPRPTRGRMHAPAVLPHRGARASTTRRPRA